jgi:hypothetical protein
MATDQPTLFGAGEQETPVRKCRTCTGPIDRKGSRCTKCVETRRDRTKRIETARKTAGVCVECKQPNLTPNYQRCKICRARRQAELARCRSGKSQTAICQQCSNPAMPGKKQCADCLQKDRDRWKLREKAIRNCRVCGIGPLPPHHKVCPDCRKEKELGGARDYQKRLVAQGKCVQCCKPHSSGKVYCPACLIRTKQQREQLKRRCMDGYGGRCICCGTAVLAFLTIDHINDDGAAQRTSGRLPSGGSGNAFYRWVVNHDFPKDLQCLCFNCQWGKRIHGVCPHQGLPRDFVIGDGL